MRFIFDVSPRKDLLRYLLNMSRSKFTSEMNILEPSIKTIDPGYNKREHILSNKVFKFILEEFGLWEDTECLNERKERYYAIKKDYLCVMR